MEHFDKSKLDSINLFRLNLQLAKLKWGETDCIMEDEENPFSDSIGITWPEADQGLPISTFFSFNQQWAVYACELKIDMQWQTNTLFLSSPLFRQLSFDDINHQTLPMCIALYYLMYQVEVMKHSALTITELLQHH